MKKNNTNKTVNTKTKQTILKGQSNDNPFLTAPSLDRVAAVIRIKEPKLVMQFKHEVLSELEAHNSDVKQIKAVKTYDLAVQLVCPDVQGVFHKDGPSISIMVQTDSANPHVRLEWNPNKVFGPLVAQPISNDHNGPLEFIDMYFLGWIGMSFFEFVSHGHVTQIDFCREILHRAPDDYLFRRKGAQTSRTFENGKGVESLYLGKRTGSHTCIYNKALEQGKEGKSVRVECKVRFPKALPIQNLWKLPDPFKPVEVFSLYCPEPPVEKGYWAAFLNSCRLRGVSKAIAAQPVKMQAKFRKCLSENVAPWWRLSEEDWSICLDDALDNALFGKLVDNPPLLSVEKLVGAA